MQLKNEFFWKNFIETFTNITVEQFTNSNLSQVFTFIKKGKQINNNYNLRYSREIQGIKLAKCYDLDVI